MDQELIAYLDERFGETSREIQGLRKEVAVSREETATFRKETAQSLERLEEKVRHNGVEIEGLRDNIRQVSEGVVGANERLDTFQRKTTSDFDDVRTEMRSLVRGAFEEIHALKTQSFGMNRQKGKSRPPS
jgi:uncharacterized protein YoxC